jgi:hypothetical protein
MRRSDPDPRASARRRGGAARRVGTVGPALRAIALVTAVGVLASVLGSAPASPQAPCAPTTTNVVAGTAEGQDHRFVRVQVSVELFDAAGVRIGMDGCPSSGGYSRVVNLNTDLGGLGSNDPTGHTRAWSLPGLPANAVMANVEAYPKSPTGTDLTRYGRSFRHNRPVGDRSIDLQLPLNCGSADNSVFGRNGSIVGHITRDGRLVAANRISAWSYAEDTEAYPMGFGIDATIPAGEFTVHHLAPNQPYMVFLSLSASAPTLSIFGLWVDPCSTTTFDYVIGKFQDVPYSHPFFADVAYLLHEEVTDGFAGNMYRPDDEVTRQAVSAWLYRLNGEPAGPLGPGAERDVVGNAFETEIRWMLATGRAEGYQDRTFRPGACVTRQAMAAFLHREVGSPPGPFPSPGFGDVPPTHPFADEVAWASSEGVVSGYADGTFRPGECITRQAAAAFVHRATA